MDRTASAYLQDYQQYFKAKAFSFGKVTLLIHEAEQFLKSTVGDEQCTILFSLCLLLDDKVYGVLQNNQRQWQWVQEDTEYAIYCHRVLVNHSNFDRMNSNSKAQVYCNLASHLSRLGRFVEAIRIWRLVDSYLPMQTAVVLNWCKSLEALALSLCNTAAINAVLCIAQAQIVRVLQNRRQLKIDEIAFAEELFSNLTELKKRPGLGTDCILKSKSEPRQSVSYPELYLNPLVECNVYSSCEHSGYSLALLPEGNQKVDYAASIFQNLRQQYIRAVTHFESAHDLLNTGAEQKSDDELTRSYEVAYALYDKAAVLANHVFSLHPQDKEKRVRRINIRSVWYHDYDYRKHELVEALQGSQGLKNWPLRGLYWLAKDIHIHGEDYPTMSPYAREQSKLRHFIVHRFVCVEPEGSANWEDLLRVKIGREEFLKRTHEVLINAREAIIYIHLALAKALSLELDSGS